MTGYVEALLYRGPQPCARLSSACGPARRRRANYDSVRTGSRASVRDVAVADGSMGDRRQDDRGGAQAAIYTIYIGDDFERMAGLDRFYDLASVRMR